MDGKELAPLLLFLVGFFVGGGQTPLTLIHPTDSIYGVAERGKESQNQGGGIWTFLVTIWASHIWRITPELLHSG